MKGGAGVSILSLLQRLIIGGVFVFAAFMKLRDPQAFSFAVHAFKILPESMIAPATFFVPWMEMICGVCLILGVWTRAAAAGIAMMLLAFIGGMVSVIVRELPVECGCFGDFFGSTKVGAGSILRNVLMLGVAIGPLVLGGGGASLDRLWSRGKSGGAREPFSG